MHPWNYVFMNSFSPFMNKTLRSFLFHRNVSLQMCFAIVLISFFESQNCLMYIQDSVPFSEYCLIMCLGELFISINP